MHHTLASIMAATVWSVASLKGPPLQLRDGQLVLMLATHVASVYHHLMFPVCGTYRDLIQVSTRVDVISADQGHAARAAAVENFRFATHY